MYLYSKESLRFALGCSRRFLPLVSLKELTLENIHEIFSLQGKILDKCAESWWNQILLCIAKVRSIEINVRCVPCGTHTAHLSLWLGHRCNKRPWSCPSAQRPFKQPGQGHRSICYMHVTHIPKLTCTYRPYPGNERKVPAAQVSCGPAFTHTELKPTWLSTSSNHGGGASGKYG